MVGKNRGLSGVCLRFFLRFAWATICFPLRISVGCCYNRLHDTGLSRQIDSRRDLPPSWAHQVEFSHWNNRQRITVSAGCYIKPRIGNKEPLR